MSAFARERRDHAVAQEMPFSKLSELDGLRGTGAERRLIVLSAGTAERRDEDAAQARELTTRVRWAPLTASLRTRKLLPLLGPRILDWASPQDVAEFAAAVEEALVAGRRQAGFLQLVSERIVAMLMDAGIRVARLKGPLLAEAIYGDQGRRLSNDIDLLVPAEQLGLAVDVVRALGYSAPSDHVGADGLPLLHFALLHERDELPPVELHWRVHWYEPSFAADSLLPPVVSDWEGWCPAPADELLALLLFYARDGFIDLRLATDLGAWWDARGATLSPTAMQERLRRYPQLAPAALAALQAAENVVGLPAARIVGGSCSLGLRQRAAIRLANPNPRASASQLYADAGLIDGLLTPARGLRAFVGRQLLPPRAILHQHARHAARRRARSRLGRFAGVSARYVLTIGRLLRAPEWRSTH